MTWPPAHEAANEDFRAQVDYLRRHASQSAARLFIQNTGEAIRRARRLPDSGSPIGNARRMQVRKFAVDIVYVSLDDDIFLVAVAHHRRQPGFWLNRL